MSYSNFTLESTLATFHVEKAESTGLFSEIVADVLVELREKFSYRMSFFYELILMLTLKRT